MSMNKLNLPVYSLILTVAISLGGCTSDEVKFQTMALIIGSVTLIFYGLSLPLVLAGRMMRARRHVFSSHITIFISLIVFVGLNALLLLVDPDIAAILFCLALMCVVGLNLAFFLGRLRIVLTGLFVFAALLGLLALFDIYRPHGFLEFLTGVYRSIQSR